MRSSNGPEGDCDLVGNDRRTGTVSLRSVFRDDGHPGATQRGSPRSAPQIQGKAFVIVCPRPEAGIVVLTFHPHSPYTSVSSQTLCSLISIDCRDVPPPPREAIHATLEGDLDEKARPNRVTRPPAPFASERDSSLFRHIHHNCVPTTLRPSLSVP